MELYFRKGCGLGYSNGRVVLYDLEGKNRTIFLSRTETIKLYESLLMDVPFADAVIRKYHRYISKESVSRRKVAIDLERLYSSIRVESQELGKKNSDLVNSYRLDFPARIVWMPTMKCSQNCKYCFVPTISPSSREHCLPSQVLTSRFKEAFSQGVSSLVIHGGDPIRFANRDQLIQVLKLADEFDVSVVISTKYEIDREMISVFREIKNLTVQVSIDTLDDAIANKLYSAPVAKIGLRNLKILKRNAISTQVNVVAMSQNYLKVPELIREVERYEPIISISRYKPSLNSRGDIFELDDEQFMKLNSLLSPTGYDIGVREFSSGVAQKICDAGRFSMCVMPNGDCVYCDSLLGRDEFIYGNLNCSSIEELWRCDSLIQLISGNMDNDPECNTCSSFQRCLKFGVCYADMLRYKCKTCKIEGV